MANFSGINLPTTGDPARDLLNYKIELERRLNHILRNIDVTQIILGLLADRLVATNASGGLESVTALQDYIAGTTNQITITDDGDGTITLSTPQNIDTSADVEFDSLKLDDLTASRIVYTDANKKLMSISNLASWIAGTSNRITITDDGDGTITLTAPQDLHTDADVTFDSIILDDLTASRLISCDANKKIVSVLNLTSWIAGTNNQISVSDDGDGSITLSTPQNIDNASIPTFAGVNISGDNIKISTTKTPSSATDTGTTGTICWDSSYIYICVSTDTWVRAELNTW